MGEGSGNCRVIVGKQRRGCHDDVADGVGEGKAAADGDDDGFRFVVDSDEKRGKVKIVVEITKRQSDAGNRPQHRLQTGDVASAAIIVDDHGPIEIDEIGFFQRREGVFGIATTAAATAATAFESR